MPHKLQPNPIPRNSPETPENEPKRRKSEIPEKTRKSPKWGTNFWRPQLFQVVSDLSENSPVDASRRAASIGEGISTGGRESGEKRPNFDPTCSSASLRPKFSPLFWRENPYWGCDEWVGRHTILRKHSTFQSQMQHRRRRRLKNAGHLDFENELRKNPGRESLHPEVRATACPSPSFKMSHFKSRSPKMGSRNFLDGLTPAFGTTKSWSHGRRRHSPLRFQLKKADPHFWDRAARSQNRGSAHISTTKTGGQGGLWTLGRQVQNSGSSIAIHLGASSGPKTGVSHFQL